MLISVLAVIIVFGVMIFSHELGHFLMAKKMGVRVEIFSLGFGPKLWSVKKGDTEYILSAIPLGGYVKMAGEEPAEERTGAEWEFYSKPVYKRFNIVITGAVINYMLGFVLFCLVFMMGAPILTSRIGAVLDGYPAQKAGLKENDKIVAIAGEEVKYWEEVLSIIHRKREHDITLQVDRDGELLGFVIRGRREDAKDIFGRPIKRTLIGIAPSSEKDFVQYGFLDSISKGAATTWNITTLTYRGIWYMLTGSISIKSAAGPIGIFAITGQAARMGISPLLWISAIISISLAIINLLPLPPLDGGHILFLAIEKIKGRPLDKRVQEIVQQAGWILLVALLLVVSWNDILRHFAK